MSGVTNSKGRILAIAKVNTRVRTAFTLVELLVVLAIIGIMVSLLLQAIQAARQTARKMSCSNNLKQLVLALDQFDASHRRYPVGRFGGGSIGANSRSWSWIAETLPFVEQQALYDEGDVPGELLGASGIADRKLGFLHCPADGYVSRGPRSDAGDLVGFKVGQTSYKGVSGANWGGSPANPIGTWFVNAGTNGSYDGLDKGDGMLWRSDFRSPMTKNQVTDGLSNTFLLGEDLPQANLWCSWPYANNAYGTCAIPPNFTFLDPNWWPNTWSFRSHHFGGALFAYADGSVHFIGDTISLDVYRAMASRAGGEVTDAVSN